MSTTTSSGDYTFAPSTYAIIQGAARLVSAIQTGETLPADEYEDMLAALNGMVTMWQASGIHVWSQVDGTLFLQPGQVDYLIGAGSPDHCCVSTDWVDTTLLARAIAGDISVQVASWAGMDDGDQIGIWLDSGFTFWTTISGTPGSTVTLAQAVPSTASSGNIVVSYPLNMVRPLKVPAARRYIFSPVIGTPIEIPMAILSRIDYANIPNKKVGGVPTEYFFDPQLGNGIFHIWPAMSPGNLNAVRFTAQRPLQDFVTQRDKADLPVEWVSCLRFNLAVEIATEYDVPADRFQIIKGLADEKFAICSSWDREPESVYFGLSDFPSTRN